MKKALLVIDTPENCYECPCFMEVGWRCQNRMDIDEEVHDKRPLWCPLKPLPRLENNEQVYQMMTKHSAMCNVGTSTKFSMLRFIDGWESCLDEIEGKK